MNKFSQNNGNYWNGLVRNTRHDTKKMPLNIPLCRAHFQNKTKYNNNNKTQQQQQQNRQTNYLDVSPHVIYIFCWKWLVSWFESFRLINITFNLDTHNSITYTYYIATQSQDTRMHRFHQMLASNKNTTCNYMYHIVRHEEVVYMFHVYRNKFSHSETRKFPSSSFQNWQLRHENQWWNIFWSNCRYIPNTKSIVA